ncbi:RdgB/HAM1 family non-canonical purine NTP pyrophosphatase [Candidatus Bipolaricaulota bacterium]|nr:RdgB/HAM1 family non-canonical purine NTP pyrophosphatase [Candidatus Bipolaricaulota bacterium]
MAQQRVLLATRNPGKIREIREILSSAPDLVLFTVDEVPFPDVDETGTTFLTNALLKARVIGELTGLAVLADDSGLEVPSLGGEPGVRSARYAGEPADYEANNQLLLQRLAELDDHGERRDRSARFVTWVVLRMDQQREFSWQGELRGRILETPRGTGGFGYDPLFVPEGRAKTLAEMGPAEKNRMSHRRRALQHVLMFFEQQRKP